MKNILIVLIILGVISAALIGVYLFKQNKTAISPEGTEPEETSEENQEGLEYESEEGSDQVLATDDFLVDLPDGWRKTEATMGVSAMVINFEEEIEDPAAQKINFKSYFAVTYDTLGEKSLNDYLQTAKNELEKVASNVVFTEDQDITINGRSAHAIEVELTQQGVDFKVLLVLVKGEGDDVWVLSFNTTKSNWDEYKELFYSVADSFNLKK
jgi:hypothetical protein